MRPRSWSAFLLIACFVKVGGAAPETEESRGLGAGVRFLLKDRLLRPWSVAIVAGDVAWLAFFVAMPFLVLTRFGEQPEIIGWILGAWGLGAVLGSAVMFRVVRQVDGLLVGSIGELAMIAPLWLFLRRPARPSVLVVAMFASGLGERPGQRSDLDDLHGPHASGSATEGVGRDHRDHVAARAAGAACGGLGSRLDRPDGNVVGDRARPDGRRAALRGRRPAGALRHRVPPVTAGARV